MTPEQGITLLKSAFAKGDRLEITIRPFEEHPYTFVAASGCGSAVDFYGAVKGALWCLRGERENLERELKNLQEIATEEGEHQ